jgi:hypothetical protein
MTPGNVFRRSGFSRDLFIFTMDIALMVANAALATVLLSA